MAIQQKQSPANVAVTRRSSVLASSAFLDQCLFGAKAQIELNSALSSAECAKQQNTKAHKIGNVKRSPSFQNSKGCAHHRLEIRRICDFITIQLHRLLPPLHSCTGCYRLVGLKKGERVPGYRVVIKHNLPPIFSPLVALRYSCPQSIGTDFGAATKDQQPKTRKEGSATD